MCQWNESALVQLMACRLFGAKPLPEPMLAYCQLDSREQISVKFESEFCHFHSRKCFWNCRLPIWRPFCPGGDELILSWYSGCCSPGAVLTKYSLYCSVHENHRIHRTFPMAKPKCLIRDFTNLNRIYKAHQTNVWWIMKYFRVH